MKRIALLALLVFAVATSQAGASTLTLNGIFTADNLVGAYTLTDLTAGTAASPLGLKLTDWQETQSFTTELVRDHKYRLSFNVFNANLATPTFSDPTAFLGQISFGGLTFLSGANSIWSVTTPTGGLLKEYGGNGQGTIWTSVNGGPINGIDLAAQWIGNGLFPGSSNAFAVHADFVATPIPAAVWLLGSGLLAIVGMRRRIFQ